MPPEKDETNRPEKEIWEPHPILGIIFRFVLPDSPKHDESEIKDAHDETEYKSCRGFPPLGGNAKTNSHQSQREAGQRSAESGVVFGEGFGAQFLAILIVFHAFQPSPRLLARRGLAQGGVELRIPEDFLQLTQTHAIHTGAVGFLPEFGEICGQGGVRRADRTFHIHGTPADNRGIIGIGDFFIIVGKKLKIRVNHFHLAKLLVGNDFHILRHGDGAGLRRLGIRKLNAHEIFKVIPLLGLAIHDIAGNHINDLLRLEKFDRIIEGEFVTLRFELLGGIRGNLDINIKTKHRKGTGHKEDRPADSQEAETSHSHGGQFIIRRHPPKNQEHRCQDPPRDGVGQGEGKHVPHHGQKLIHRERVARQ